MSTRMWRRLISCGFPNYGIILYLVIFSTVLFDGCGPSVLLQSIRATAEQGDANAQHSLGVIYAKGERVPQDHAEAARWIRAAAKQGLAEAQAHLGVLYMIGKGVPQDFERAYAWMRTAEAQGYSGPEVALKVLEQEETLQLAEAERLAQKYRENYVSR